MGGSPGGVVPPNYVKIFVSQISTDIKKNWHPRLSPFKNLIFWGPILGGPRGESGVHARYTVKKKVSVYLNKDFVCKKCRSVVKNFKESDEKLCDGVETVSKFTYLGDRLNATDGCETEVTARLRIGWIKFRACSEILKDRRF